MADIALLVVEEYERRKRWEKEEMDGLRNMVSSYVSSLRSKANGFSSSVKEKVAQVGAMEVQLARKAMEPKSPFALAAFEGFFPA